jgi:hypothetical protein
MNEMKPARRAGFLVLPGVRQKGRRAIAAGPIAHVLADRAEHPYFLGRRAAVPHLGFELRPRSCFTVAAFEGEVGCA